MQADRPLILIHVDGMPVGGIERQVLQLLEGLRRSGRFRTALAMIDRGGALEAEAAALVAEIVPMRRRHRLDVTPALALLAYCRRAPVRLIHVFGWISGLAGLCVARVVRVPILNASVQSAPMRALQARERISRWCALRSDAIVANSQAGLRAFGLSNHPRAHVVHSAVDFRRFVGVVPEKGEGPKVCMVAGFSRFKDHVTAIRAMPPVLREYPSAQLILVGWDFGTATQTEQLVQELGLGGSVRIVRGAAHSEPYIAGSDVCLLASTQGEGLSVAILEYMALCKPVVATDCGGNAEVVRHGETGFLVPVRSPEALAAQILELLRHPDRARQMGQAGRQRVASEFSLEKIVAKYEQLYGDLLCRETPGRGRDAA